MATLSFKDRLNIIRNQIVNVRNEAIVKGLINKSLEPFSIRNKDFWELVTVPEVRIYLIQLTNIKRPV